MNETELINAYIEMGMTKEQAVEAVKKAKECFDVVDEASNETDDTITVRKTIRFEMPTCCRQCPIELEDQYGNATITSCALLNDPDWVKNTIDYRKPVRDPKCPLIKGKTYDIAGKSLRY